MAEQNRTEQNRTEQNRTEQNRTEQNRTEQIDDYVTGRLVFAKPEEIDAVQPFSKKLVEVYGFPKTHIITHPQYRVKRRPSDTSKSYPVDIAVFSSVECKDDDVTIIVECKQKNRNDGRSQLENYLTLSRANLGVWFNGNDFLAIRKLERAGKVNFQEIPDIPKYGERLEDVGLYKRKNLIIPHDLINEFKIIRNYLAGNAKGMTNDMAFAQEVINIIMCKLYDEKYTPPDDTVRFRFGFQEPSTVVSRRINEIFTDTKQEYSDVFSDSDNISLDDRSLAFVVSVLQKFTLIDAERDVIAEAFEIFIGPSLRGSQGQFFTPRNVVKTVIEIIDPKPNEYVIDPACGSGGFLSECLRYVHQQIEIQGKKLGWSIDQIKDEKITKVSEHLRGIERDAFLSKVAKAYMVILGDGRSGIRSEDALDLPENWHNNTNAMIHFGKFDVVITNPPFGSKIPVKGNEKLEQFELGHKWKKNGYSFTKGNVKKQVPPQIVFIDRCLDFLRDGGRMGIVLPDGVLSNTTEEYIRFSISSRAEIIGLIDLPMNTFLPSTPTKTHLLFLRKKSKFNPKHKLFMSYAKTCGHDKRGKKTASDEIREIPTHLRNLKNNKSKPSHLGVFTRYNELQNNIWLPKYYNPDIDAELKEYIKNNHEIKTIQELVDEKAIVKIKKGHEIGSKNYGTGDIPFIRTSELGNLEIMTDPTHCTSHDVWNKYKKRQDIDSEDILLVRDGTYLIGRTAIITKLDNKIIIQSHLNQIKVDKKKLSPYLLLALLNLDVVQKQLESKSFRQGTISTLGNRLGEIKLPIPTNNKVRCDITETMKNAITLKHNAKKTLLEFEYNSKKQSLMGIKNRGNQGNL